MVRPGCARGPRDGVTAAFGVARHAEQVGGASWASSQFNGSTGLLWRCRLTPEIQAASDDNSSGLPSAQCREREGVFRDSPAGAAAGRRRATEILVGGGTRARLHGAAAPRDPEYLDLLWVGSQAKRPRVRVQQTQGCVAAVPFFSPHIAARPLRRVPWGGEGSRKTARKNPSVKLRLG